MLRTGQTRAHNSKQNLMQAFVPNLWCCSMHSPSSETPGWYNGYQEEWYDGTTPAWKNYNLHHVDCRSLRGCIQMFQQILDTSPVLQSNLLWEFCVGHNKLKL